MSATVVSQWRSPRCFQGSSKQCRKCTSLRMKHARSTAFVRLTFDFPVCRFFCFSHLKRPYHTTVRRSSDVIDWAEMVNVPKPSYTNIAQSWISPEYSPIIWTRIVQRKSLMRRSSGKISMISIGVRGWRWWQSVPECRKRQYRRRYGLYETQPHIPPIKNNLRISAADKPPFCK